MMSDGVFSLAIKKRENIRHAAFLLYRYERNSEHGGAGTSRRAYCQERLPLRVSDITRHPLTPFLEWDLQLHFPTQLSHQLYSDGATDRLGYLLASSKASITTSLRDNWEKNMTTGFRASLDLVQRDLKRTAGTETSPLPAKESEDENVKERIAIIL
jgi:hypothetical protein